MRRIFFLLQKEFLQIFRNRMMIPIIFVMPFMQLLILANAATFEIKNLKIIVIDRDKTSTSRELITKFQASNYFILSGYAESDKIAEKQLRNRNADLYMIIPANFERELLRENKGNIQLIINAIDGMKASVAMNYSNAIIMDFNNNFRNKYLTKVSVALPQSLLKKINIIPTYWYNPLLNYKVFMVPGILVLLVTMIGAFLSAINIAREKEIGTIEQINVTPIRKYEFIIGKLLPFWIIGLFELAFGLVLSYLIYDLEVVGSLLVLFSFAAIYLLCALGFGLFISTISNTQQQAMYITWFFMVVFILLSGVFTAIENMPQWTQYITMADPVRYFIEVIRMVMLKGAGFAETKNHFIIISIFAILLNSLAIMRYRKTS